MPCSQKKFADSTEIRVRPSRPDKESRTYIVWVAEPRDTLAETMVADELHEEHMRYLMEQSKAYQESHARALASTADLRSSKKMAKTALGGSEQDVGMGDETEDGSSEELGDAEVDGEQETDSEPGPALELPQTKSEEPSEVSHPCIPQTQTEAPSKERVHPPQPSMTRKRALPQSWTPRKEIKLEQETATREFKTIARSRSTTPAFGIPQNTSPGTNIVAVQTKQSKLASLRQALSDSEEKNKLLWELVDVVQEQKALLRGSVEILEWKVARGIRSGIEHSDRANELAEKEKVLLKKLGM